MAHELNLMKFPTWPMNAPQNVENRSSLMLKMRAFLKILNSVCKQDSVFGSNFNKNHCFQSEN